MTIKIQIDTALVYCLLTRPQTSAIPITSTFYFELDALFVLRLLVVFPEDLTEVLRVEFVLLVVFVALVLLLEERLFEALFVDL